MSTKTIKTAELTGAALDWAVAKAEGWKCYPEMGYGGDPWMVGPENVGGNQTGFLSETLHYSTDWAQGGPIIEREVITVRPVIHAERTESGADVGRQDGWAAHTEPAAYWITPRAFKGPTPLIAALRAFVASKLGDEVEVPEELLARSAA